MSLTESFREQLMRDLAAGNSPDETLGLPLPQGARSLEELPPNIQLEMLSTPQGLGLPATVQSPMRRRATEQLDSQTNRLQNIDRMNEVLNTLGFSDPNATEEETRRRVNRTFGSVQDSIIGTGNPETDSWWQRLASIAPATVSQDFRQGRSARRQLQGVFSAEAYDALRGAGAISNFELQTVMPSVHQLNAPNIDEDLAYEHLKRINEVNQLAQNRQTAGIQVNPATNQEWMLDRANNQWKRVYSYIDGETGRFVVRDVPVNEDVVNLPFNITDEQARNIVEDLPPGRIFIYKGKAMRKGQR